jgi:hypothetical protein
MINVPISYGELFDKITILEIKMKKIGTANVAKEHILLVDKGKGINVGCDLIQQLRDINEKLWVIEDKIRLKEKAKQFDQDFINLARSVYIQNDRRAAIKKEINKQLNSEIVEEKQYTNYLF